MNAFSATPQLDIAYYHDSTNQLTIREIADTSFASHFAIASSPRLNFGMSSDTYWLRITVQNPDAEVRSWYLTVDYPPLDTVFFYQTTLNGTWQVDSAGDKLSFNRADSYRKPVFPFTLDSALPHTYYLKVRTQGTAQIPIKVRPQDTLLSTIGKAELVEGLFYGAMLLLVLYNLFLFFSLREKSYLFYCLFVASNTFALAGLQGQLNYHLPWLNQLYDQIFISSMFAGVFWAIIFAIFFLQSKFFAPRMHLALILSAVASGTAFLLSYIIPYQFSAKLVAVLVAVTPFVAWWSGVSAWRNGNTSARFFVFAWTFYLVSVVLISLRNFGWIDEQFHLENIIQIGSVVEALLLSFALADKINLLRAEKIEAQQRALQVSLENEQIIRNQNQVLEDRIRERTHEISDQNEELRQQQEVIEELNRQLVLHSERLESEVSDRTLELTTANKRLINQNNHLDRFAYIVSHNLRGPLAQIMGMVTILDKDNLNDYNQNCFVHLEKTVERLDTVIRDLNQILVYRDQESYQLTKTPIRRTIDKVLKRMHPTLSKENVLIHNDLDYSVRAFTIELYLENVIEELITNAIKYRSERRLVEIRFKARSHGNQLILYVSDNGLGIDLERYQDKIFGLYQQFYTHKEGRGVGLYLAKTQIETMDGRIEVSSELGKGSTFRIYLRACPSSQEVVHEEHVRL